MSLRIDLDAAAFEPGAEVRGRVDWRPDGPAPETVLISLLWHTEGKGTEDVEIVDQVRVDRPRPQGHHDFSFRLPDFPWSFTGTLVSLVWAVEASLEPRGAVERVNLVSAPGGERIVLAAESG